MNALIANLSIHTPVQRVMIAFSKHMYTFLEAPSQTHLPKHVGMFAGSLLTYGSWAPPKVPH